VIKAWAKHRANDETVAMLAPANDTVVRLNQLAQQRRLTAGELAPDGTLAIAGPYQLRVGDEVVTRHNDRTLRTDRGAMVRNRDRWTIATITRSGDLIAHGPSGTIRLPHDYVAEHVELGYAQTSHAAQGRTVDRSLLLLDGPTDARGIYVPMTRGRYSNDVYVVTDDDRPATDVVAEALSRDWIDTPAIVRRAELQRRPVAVAAEHVRPVPLSGPELLALLQKAHDLADRIATHDSETRNLPRRLQQARSSHARTVAELAQARDELAWACQTLAALDRPLVRRLHRSEVDQAPSTCSPATTPSWRSRPEPPSSTARSVTSKRRPPRSRWPAPTAPTGPPSSPTPATGSPATSEPGPATPTSITTPSSSTGSDPDPPTGRPPGCGTPPPPESTNTAPPTTNSASTSWATASPGSTAPATAIAKPSSKPSGISMMQSDRTSA